MELQPRFRFRSVSLALRELEGCRSKSKLEQIISFVGLGVAFRKKYAQSITSNKTDIVNFISNFLEDNYLAKNEEGHFIADELVEEAARSYMYQRRNTYSWNEREEEIELTELQRSLLIDGWKIQANKLYPIVAEELSIATKRNGIAERLTMQGWSDALRYLENIENALEQGAWEPANASCRSLLSELFAAICRTLLPDAGAGLTEGPARKHLSDNDFFRKAADGKKLESDFVQSLIAMVGMEGAHVGISTMQNAIFNYHLSILTANFFLTRLEAASKIAYSK